MVESSTKPPAYFEPNTASTKRALFSELDKSFNKPAVSLEPAASPSLPPQSVEIRAPSINPASSKAVTAPPKPPAPIKPSTKASRPRNPASRWEIVYILIVAFIILATVAVIGYIVIQRRGQAQAPAIEAALNLQQTLVVAQTLTSLPLPTLIPTWTPIPTWTGVPTATFTPSPTPSPTQVPTATKTPRPPSQVGPVAGLYAPDFTLTELASGNQVTLSQYDGQPVLIYFWATWCNNCSIEMGSIESISQANKGAGLVVLTVNAAEVPAIVTKYRTDNNLTVPILLDPDSVFKNAYNVNLNTIPIHFFIDSSDRIKSIRMGQMTQAELQGQVDAILPQGPTPTP
jgi:peroxiredoxin